MTPEPRRGPGRPPRSAANGGGTQAPKPLTATERLADLQAQREANGGWLVKPPPGIDGARMVLQEGETLGQPNAAWMVLVAWFEEIVAAGGSPADLDRAWSHWNPPIWPGGTHPRAVARDAFDAIKQRAGKQSYELHAQAERERLEERAAAARALAKRREPYVEAVRAAQEALEQAKKELEAVR